MSPKNEIKENMPEIEEAWKRVQPRNLKWITASEIFMITLMMLGWDGSLLRNWTK